ncbi:MAG: type II toxin-antitoxin system RelE/ParE family toxin [Proteobacteria bacterium]|nr:type II toxin-antitoxin system RelE/ParE family toxin [Pseudomonadota bacterium]
MKVFWTDRAKQRLRKIHAYIARDAPQAADRVARAVLLRSRDLETHAYAGRRVPEYARNDVRELMQRPYRIIYAILPDRIDVVAVMHYRQLLPGDVDELRVGDV